MTSGELLSTPWQMWATIAFIIGAVALYFSEKFSIESVSVAIVAVLLLFFTYFPIEGVEGLDQQGLLSGFANPALFTIMALLVIGQGMFHTGALEGPTQKLTLSMKKKPVRTMFAVFGIAFFVSAFMNNTPVVVMFIPVLVAIAGHTHGSASRVMMPLSFVCILAGMTTLIGSSTNLLVADVLFRTEGIELGMFSLTKIGLILAFVGVIYIVLFSKYLLPDREDSADNISDEGRQYIAQISVTKSHPLSGVSPTAGLFPTLRDVTVRMIQRGDHALLPPYEHPLEPGDTLIVAATRHSLAKLLASHPEYLQGMLRIGDYGQDSASTNQSSIVLSEAVIAPGSRMVGRTIEASGFRQETGCLVLGIQRRSRMIRKRMLEIRLEPGDVLLLFGYDSAMSSLRNSRDLLTLDLSTKDVPDIRKATVARIIFGAVIIAAASNMVPFLIASLFGAIAMVATGCLNVRQSVRALDMRIFFLIGAAFAMGLAMEKTGAAAYLAQTVLTVVEPYGARALIAALFLLVAILTNILSNAATAILFAPIALNLVEQSTLDLDPTMMILTVIFAANCSFATPIAYQTNLLVMGPGKYQFADFAKFGVPLILLLWITYVIVAPFFFGI